MSDHKLAEALRQIIYQAERGTLARCEQLARDALASIYEAEQKAGEAVAWVDERAIAWLDGRSRTATITTKLQAGKSLERPMPLFAHPQQPLTEEQIRLERKRIDPMAEDMDAWSFGQGVRFAERAHGIGITKDTK